LPAPEFGHFVPIAARRIATPLTSMVLRCVVENEDTGIGIRATAQMLEFCRDQKFDYRPRENRKSQMLAFERRARSMQMKAPFTLDRQNFTKRIETKNTVELLDEMGPGSMPGHDLYQSSPPRMPQASHSFDRLRRI
jgi:hypothetical protein